MTEQELQTLLSNMDVEDLKTLKECYTKYLKEQSLIEIFNTNLSNFKQAQNQEIQPTEDEVEVRKALDTIIKMPRKRRYKVDGFLNESQRIKTLSIEENPLNPRVFQNREYAKIFFKKSGNHLTNAGIFLALSIILFSIGITLNYTPINLIAIVALFPALMNLLDNVTNNTLETVSKFSISRKQMNNVIKKLTRDYEKEKQHSENVHMQNLAFIDSKEDIFEKRLAIHKANLAELASEIREILKSNLNSVSLTEEELEDTQILLKSGNQKILKL